VPALFLFEPRVLLGVHRRLRTPALPATGWFHRLAAWSVDPAARLPRDGIGVAPAPEGPR
jgi:hypothetical protein